MKPYTRIMFVFILAVMFTLAALLVVRHVGAQEIDGGVALTAQWGENSFTVRVWTDDGKRIIVETISIQKAENLIYYYTYGVHIYYPCCGQVARKRLHMKVEYNLAEDLLKVLNASSPNVIFPGPKAYKFHWQWINDEDLSPSGWDVYEYKYATSKLWCDLFRCKDFTYELLCKVYGGSPGYLECYYGKWE